MLMKLGRSDLFEMQLGDDWIISKRFAQINVAKYLNDLVQLSLLQLSIFCWLKISR